MMPEKFPLSGGSLEEIAQAALDRLVSEYVAPEYVAPEYAAPADAAMTSHGSQGTVASSAGNGRFVPHLTDEGSARSLQYFRERYGVPQGSIADGASLHGAATQSLPYYLADSAHGASAHGASPPDSVQPPSPVQRVPAVSRGTEYLPTSSSSFDVLQVRRDFPILSEMVHGKPLVWLDNAATTQKPRAVIDRLSQFYLHENSNVHRAAHELARRSTDAYEAARATVARFLNAGSPDEIIFVRGTTEGINLIAQSWGRRNIGAGDAVVISHLEHHANIVPWQLVCQERNARLLVAPVDNTGQIVLSAFEALLDDSVKLVSISHVSNALGTITPAEEIIQIAHRRGIRVLLDAAQSISHMPVDVRQLDCDFCVFSGHKVFGPTGIGAVYGKEAILDGMPPWQGGGNMIQNVTFDGTTFQKAPMRFEAGTGNIADAVGLGAALDYVSHWGMRNISRYEHELLHHATEKLMRVNGLRMIGTAAEKAAVLSFVVPELDSMEIGKFLTHEGIAVRVGHHCAQPILRRFGVENSIRASLALYNTVAETDFLAETVHRAVTRLRGSR